jgi:hypothetical protein
MTTFDDTRKLLAEDVPDAKARHADLMTQITKFEKNWEQFQAVKDQAPAPTAVAAGSTYRTS